MTIVSYFLDKPASRWRKFLLWAHVTRLDARDWCLRWIHAQHNARVIIDFEDRMTSVVYAASGGVMSKPYYTKEAILTEIERHNSETWDDGYYDGRKDLAEELGVEDPQKEIWQ